jgi:hypothetical protein
LTSFQEEFYVSNSLSVDVCRRESAYAWTETAPDVVLQARPRVRAVEIHLARGDQKVSMDKIYDAISEIGGEIRTVVGAAIPFETTSYVNPRIGFRERQLHVRICLVIPEQNIEARLLLLDEVVLESQRFFVVGDYDVVDVDCLPHKRSRFGIRRPSFVKIGTYPITQVLGLPYVNNLSLGVFVEVHAGSSGNGADFGVNIHRRE